jgi:hypothetical protein
MATIDTAAMSLAAPRKLARGWSMMSIPFEEIEQSNSRIGLVTACTVDALVSYLPKFKRQKHKTPGFFRNQGFCLHRIWR